MNVSVGQTFGRWSVLVQGPSNPQAHALKWSCKCQCGTTKIVRAQLLVSGRSKSCGCGKSQFLLNSARITHGFSGTPIHKAWRHAKDRSRVLGVPLDTNWLNFEGFLLDNEATWFERAIFMRTDSTKGFTKDNCKWAPRYMLGISRKDAPLFVYNGHKVTMAHLSRVSGISRATIWRRLKSGWSVEKAVSVPANSYHGRDGHFKLVVAKRKYR